MNRQSAPLPDSVPRRLIRTFREAKPLLYALGTAIFAASLIFIGVLAARNWSALSDVHILDPAWFGASVALYAVSHLSTGLAWSLAVRKFDESISVADGVRIGLVAQIGKYLPGNIAHYFGRGVLARAEGVALRSSGLSTLVELLSALTAALVVAFIAIVADPMPLAFAPQLDDKSVVITSTILMAAFALALWVARRGQGLRSFAAPTACLAVSLTLSGLSLAALLASLGYVDVSPTAVVGAFAVAWAAGFIVPGAPAGLGIREAILIAFLTQETGPGAALACAILHRLITAGVDALAALAGYGWFASVALSKK